MLSVPQKRKRRSPDLATLYRRYHETKAKLAAAGIDDCAFEAMVIMETVTGKSKAEIIGDYESELTLDEERKLLSTLALRMAHYPLQYILGYWEFYGRKFLVGEGVLIPRQDTEKVIEVCIEHLKDIKRPKIIDLCAGSGCIGITLAKEVPNSSVIMIEKYEHAIRYVLENASEISPENTTLIMDDIFDDVRLTSRVHLIVSNPPYLSDEDMKDLQPELLYEPETAFYGGSDGLYFYRRIAKEYKRYIKPKGALVFEIGAAQGEAVKDILEKEGYADVRIIKDYSRNDRVVIGTVPRV